MQKLHALAAAAVLVGALGSAQAQTVRPEVGKPLQQASDLLKAGKAREALAKVREADAVGGKTAHEQFMIDRMRGSAAQRAGDNGTAIQAFEAVFNSGKLSGGEQAQIAESIAMHLSSPLRLIRSLVPSMVARGYGRIVNVSSGWGSFAEGMQGPGDYGITKAAMNALTVRLAKELPAAVKVNAMCPGWVRTRMGGEGATRTPDEGADTAGWLATLPDDGPTGGFFRDRKPIDW